MDDLLQAALVIADFGAKERERIIALAAVLQVTLKNRQKVLIMGNGGSAAEASHLAAELVGRFNGVNTGYAAIALNDPPVMTAIANDYGYEYVFSKQIEAMADFGDTAIAFSTSGKSQNILNGLLKAQSMGLPTALITGGYQVDDSVADFVIRVPSLDPARIQECHLVLIHYVCSIIKGVKE
jgi:D-sedoheptulose 7-phosphate isomerase